MTKLSKRRFGVLLSQGCYARFYGIFTTDSMPVPLHLLHFEQLPSCPMLRTEPESAFAFLLRSVHPPMPKHPHVSLRVYPSIQLSVRFPLP